MWIFFPVYVCAWCECNACVGQKRALSVSCFLVDRHQTQVLTTDRSLAPDHLSPTSTLSRCYKSLTFPPTLKCAFCNDFSSQQPHCSFMYQRVGTTPTSFEWPVAQCLRVWVCFYVPGLHDLAGLNLLFFVSSLSLIPWTLPTNSSLPSLTLGSLLLSSAVPESSHLPCLVIEKQFLPDTYMSLSVLPFLIII